MQASGGPIQTPPVLLLIYNRPATTKKVLEAIGHARPDRFYVAADGPRRSRAGDEARCAEARRIATQVDFECHLTTLFRDENLGCRLAVSSALDWFFDHEPEGIVLEDDCVPDPSFFDYCADLLVRYRDDPRVMAISGNGSHAEQQPRPHSYLFSRYNHVWGWASWRDAWADYDTEMEAWPYLRTSSWLNEVGDGHRDFVRYWRAAFDAAYNGEVDSWAYRWTYSCWRQGGLTALPSRNIVKNIGFGVDSTHTDDEVSWLAQLPLQSLDLPLVHPPAVRRDSAADRWMDLHVFGTRRPVHRRVLGPLARVTRRTTARPPLKRSRGGTR